MQNAVPPGGLYHYSTAIAYHTGISLQQLGAAQAPAPPPAPLPTEIKAGEIVAWRCWWVRDGKYHSTSLGTPWELDKPMEGKNLSMGVEGVHAWKTLAQAEKYAGELGVYSQGQLAVGTIELWGEVIEHDEGYRAQFGQIKEIVETLATTGPGTFHYVAIPKDGSGATIDNSVAPLVFVWGAIIVAIVSLILVYGFR